MGQRENSASFDLKKSSFSRKAIPLSQQSRPSRSVSRERSKIRPTSGKIIAQPKLASRKCVSRHRTGNKTMPAWLRYSIERRQANRNTKAQAPPQPPANIIKTSHKVGNKQQDVLSNKSAISSLRISQKSARKEYADKSCSPVFPATPLSPEVSEKIREPSPLESPSTVDVPRDTSDVVPCIPPSQEPCAHEHTSRTKKKCKNCGLQYTPLERQEITEQVVQSVCQKYPYLKDVADRVKSFIHVPSPIIEMLSSRIAPTLQNRTSENRRYRSVDSYKHVSSSEITPVDVTTTRTVAPVRLLRKVKSPRNPKKNSRPLPSNPPIKAPEYDWISPLPHTPGYTQPRRAYSKPPVTFKPSPVTSTLSTEPSVVGYKLTSPPTDTSLPKNVTSSKCLEWYNKIVECENKKPSTTERPRIEHRTTEKFEPTSKCREWYEKIAGEGVNKYDCSPAKFECLSEVPKTIECSRRTVPTQTSGTVESRTQAGTLQPWRKPPNRVESWKKSPSRPPVRAESSATIEPASRPRGTTRPLSPVKAKTLRKSPVQSFNRPEKSPSARGKSPKSPSVGGNSPKSPPTIRKSPKSPIANAEVLKKLPNRKFPEKSSPSASSKVTSPTPPPRRPSFKSPTRRQLTPPRSTIVTRFPQTENITKNWVTTERSQDTEGIPKFKFAPNSREPFGVNKKRYSAPGTQRRPRKFDARKTPIPLLNPSPTSTVHSSYSLIRRGTPTPIIRGARRTSMQRDMRDQIRLFKAKNRGTHSLNPLQWFKKGTEPNNGIINPSRTMVARRPSSRVITTYRRRAPIALRISKTIAPSLSDLSSVSMPGERVSPSVVQTTTVAITNNRPRVRLRKPSTIFATRPMNADWKMTRAQIFRDQFIQRKICSVNTYEDSWWKNFNSKLLPQRANN